MTQAGQVQDPGQRRALFAEAFRMVTERAYFLPLFTYAKTYGFSRQLAFAPFYDDNPRFYRAKWK